MSVYQQIVDGEFSGEKFEAAVDAGLLPEYSGNGFFLGIRDHVAGECPYHQESLMEHVRRIIDDSISLANRFELADLDRIALVTSATWHDVGKIFARIEKLRAVCPKCFRSYPATDAGEICQTADCDGILIERIVVGYHNHADVGGEDWVWGRIAHREGASDGIASHVKRLISFHSVVHKAIIRGREHLKDPISVLLSWADETARDHPPYIDPRGRRHPRVYEREYFASIERIKKNETTAKTRTQPNDTAG